MNTQKQHMKSNKDAKDVLKKLLSSISQDTKNYDDNTYAIRTSINHHTGRIYDLELNSLLGGEVKIVCPGASVLTAKVEVEIPNSIMGINSHGSYQTGRKLEIIFKYRNTARERISMDFVYFQDTSEETILKLLNDYEEKMSNFTPDVINHFRDEVNFFNENNSIVKNYKDKEKISKFVSNFIKPYIVNVEYLKNATDNSNKKEIDDINNNENKNSFRKYFCFKGLLGEDFKELRKITSEVSDILYKRFKTEQNLGIIPDIAGYLKKYKDEINQLVPK